MIETIFVAPKGCSEQEAMVFAQQNLCGLELETFLLPSALYDNQALDRLQRQLQHYRGPLSLHGPVIDINPVSLDKDIADISKRRYVKAIDAALALGARFLVLHTQWSPIYTVAQCEAAWLDGMACFYQELIEQYVKDTPLTLLVENFLEPSPYVLSQLMARVDSPYLRACLDIGHINLFSDLPASAWFAEVGPYTATIHAHNNDGLLDGHTAFDEGNAHVMNTLQAIAQSSHKVQLVIEVRGLESVARSLAQVRPMVETQRQRLVAASFLI